MLLKTPCLLKGGEIQKNMRFKTLNLSRNIVSLQVVGRCFAFFILHDQFVARQNLFLRAEQSYYEK